MISDFKKFNESNTEDIRSINNKILYDIDVILSFIEDLKDVGFKTPKAYVAQSPTGDRYVSIYPTDGGLSKYINDRIESDMKTIQYSITADTDSLKTTEDELNLIIDSFKHKLEDFTYCRIGNITIDINKRSVGHHNKDNFVEKNTIRASINIQLNNLKKTRYKKDIN